MLFFSPWFFFSWQYQSILKRGKYPTSCASCRPVTVACTLSEVFEYVLLPDLLSKLDYMSNQFSFKPYIGCQHAPRAIASLLLEAHKMVLRFIFVHSMFEKHLMQYAIGNFFSTKIQFCTNVSIVSTLRFWCANSYVQLKSGHTYVGNIPIRSDPR